MKTRIATLVPCLLFAFWGVAMGATWYVDDSVSSSGDGTSWQTAFQTIQQGIDAASDSDTVLVAEGTYVENIRFNGKNITLTATDPLNPYVVGNTIIDGNQSGSVVAFSGTEDETCALSGFTIRNGKSKCGGGISSATVCDRTRATIRYNVIVANWAESGGGLAWCEGTIEGNTVTRNSAGWGGGGLYWCHGTIRNCIISHNSASECGGGLYFCDGAIENNTIVDNRCSNEGSGLSDCDGTIRNCIFWEERPSRVRICSDWNSPTYCCIKGWRGGGEGNIGACPYFVDAEAEDYHLQPWSPCVDAGDPASPFFNEPEPNGDRINMGAYGNTLEATTGSLDGDADSLPDDWELLFFGHIGQGASDDRDGDGWSNLQEYHRGANPAASLKWYVNGSVKASGGGTSLETAFRTIGEGIEAAGELETVTVVEGIYDENICFLGRNIVLTSTEPLDPAVVGGTIIQGNWKESVVHFAGTEDEACILRGFTITGGNAKNGGGVSGHETHATIENNVITQNAVSGVGGGIDYCDGIIENNVITWNCAGHGGGLARCCGAIRNNKVTNNSSGYDGGGMAYCGGEILDNLVSRNTGRYGGGLYSCGTTIRGNAIIENEAYILSGGGLYYCGGTIKNNLVCSNSANTDGGGFACCYGTIENNTVFGNTAKGEGGGAHQFCYQSYTIRNCIIWGNKSNDGRQLASQGKPTYCCIQGWRRGGTGNISAFPHFVDPEGGDYHLRSWSPCIDAGDPASDFSKEPGPNGGVINMGAYGNTPQAASASQDVDKDLLPDDWEMLFFEGLSHNAAEDADGNGWSNLQEYLHGSDPTRFMIWYVFGGIAVSGDGRSWETAFRTIQEGLLAASELDRVVVAPGAYGENVRFPGRNMTLTSADPLSTSVVANTVIDGRGSGPVIAFAGSEDETCILAGFTICNGNAEDGGGVMGRGTGATIERSVITSNSASNTGGGLWECDGTIRDNRISENSANGKGGALAFCDGAIQNDLITGNWARQHGGGLYECNGIIKNDVIIQNSSSGSAGAMFLCRGTIMYNRITANMAAENAGGLGDCEGMIHGNVISGNTAGQCGGGMHKCKGEINNNSLLGNIAGNTGGGLYYCHNGVVRNCIVWGNSPNDMEVPYSCGRMLGLPPSHCCVGGWTGEGEANITADPAFLDAGNGDVRLLPGSPCIDAGFNSPDLPEFDIAGMHRIMFGGKSLTVDMGAYEFYTNKLEAIPGRDETLFTWSSLANKTYSIFYSEDLLTWHLAVSALPSSSSQTTSWLDDGSLTGVRPLLVPRRFYRVLENP